MFSSCLRKVLCLVLSFQLGFGSVFASHQETIDEAMARLTPDRTVPYVRDDGTRYEEYFLTTLGHNCLFAAFNKTREEAVQKILDHLLKGSQTTAKLLDEAIETDLLNPSIQDLLKDCSDEAEKRQTYLVHYGSSDTMVECHQNVNAPEGVNTTSLADVMAYVFGVTLKVFVGEAFNAHDLGLFHEKVHPAPRGTLNLHLKNHHYNLLLRERDPASLKEKARKNEERYLSDVRLHYEEEARLTQQYFMDCETQEASDGASMENSEVASFMPSSPLHTHPSSREDLPRVQEGDTRPRSPRPVTKRVFSRQHINDFLNKKKGVTLLDDPDRSRQALWVLTKRLEGNMPSGPVEKAAQQLRIATYRCALYLDHGFVPRGKTRDEALQEVIKDTENALESLRKTLVPHNKQYKAALHHVQVYLGRLYGADKRYDEAWNYLSSTLKGAYSQAAIIEMVKLVVDKRYTPCDMGDGTHETYALALLDGKHKPVSTLRAPRPRRSGTDERQGKLSLVHTPYLNSRDGIKSLKTLRESLVDTEQRNQGARDQAPQMRRPSLEAMSSQEDNPLLSLPSIRRDQRVRPRDNQEDAPQGERPAKRPRLSVPSPISSQEDSQGSPSPVAEAPRGRFVVKLMLKRPRDDAPQEEERPRTRLRDASYSPETAEIRPITSSPLNTDQGAFGDEDMLIALSPNASDEEDLYRDHGGGDTQALEEIESLLLRGKIAGGRRDTQEAMVCFQKAYDASRLHDLPLLQAQALLGLGNAQFTGELDARHVDQVYCYKQALTLARTLQDKDLEIKAYLGLGNVQFAGELDGKRVDQGHCHKQALALARALQDKEFEARAYLGLGNAQFTGELDGQRVNSIFCYKRVLTLARTLQDNALEAKAYLGLGNAQFKGELHGERVDQVHCYKQALTLARTSQDRDLEAKAYLGLGNSLFRGELDGERVDQVYCYKKVLTFARTLQDKGLEAKAYLGLGNSLFRGDLDGERVNQVYCYRQVLTLALSLQDKDLEARAYLGLGNAQFRGELDGERVDQVHSYKQALTLALSLQDKDLEARAYLGLGNAQFKGELNGERVNSTFCYKQALTLARALQDKDLEAKAYLGLGNALFTGELDGKRVDQIHCYKRVLILALELQNKSLEADAYLGLGNAQFSGDLHGKLINEIHCYKKVLTLALELHDKDLEAKAYLGLGNARFEGDLDGGTVNSTYCYRQVLTLAHVLHDKELEAKAYLGFGNAQFKGELNGERVNSTFCYKQVLTLAIELQDKNLEAKAYLGLGNARFEGDLDGGTVNSTYCYKQVLALALELHDKELEAKAYLGFGNAKFTGELDGQRVNDTYCYKHVLSLARTLQDKDLEVKAYLGLGNAKFRGELHGERVNDIHCYLEARRLAHTLQDKDLEAKAYLGLGNAQFRGELNGERVDQVYCHRQALKLANGNDFKFQAQCHRGLGNVYGSQRQNEKAKEHFEEGLRLAKKAGDSSLVRTLEGCLQRVERFLSRR